MANSLAVSHSLIGNGDLFGNIQVPDNTLYAIGAFVTMSAQTVPSRSVQVVSKVGTTGIVLADATGKLVDLTLYTVLRKAFVSQSVQTVSGSTEGTASKIVEGLLYTAPTGASTQITGAGLTTWNVNYGQGLVAVGGFLKDIAVGTTQVVSTGSPLLAAGQSLMATAYVYLSSSNVPTLAYALGTAATTGQQVAPTTAQVQTAADTASSLPAGTTLWIPVASLTLNRTADTTLTQSQDNTIRAY